VTLYVTQLTAPLCRTVIGKFVTTRSPSDRSILNGRMRASDYAILACGEHSDDDAAEHCKGN
jgi:hypothetical protein